MSNLQKMVKERAYIGRECIQLYVGEAVALGDKALAEDMLEVARSQHVYSRALVEAEKMVN